MIKLWLLYIMLLLVTACKEPQSGQKNGAPVPTEKVSPKIAKKIMSITKKTASKLSYGEAKNSFGFILKEEEILLGRDPLHEFRGNLSVIFTPEEIRSKTIKIKEVTWEKDSVNNITVWYQDKQEKWIPIDVFQWVKGSEF